MGIRLLDLDSIVDVITTNKILEEGDALRFNIILVSGKLNCLTRKSSRY